MSFTAKQIRNICLLGHSGTGKTTLVENMLYLTGAIARMGRRRMAIPSRTTIRRRSSVRCPSPPP